jgi:hypothetical protein
MLLLLKGSFSITCVMYVDMAPLFEMCNLICISYDSQ